MGSRTAKSCGPDSPTLESSLSMMIGRRWWLTSPAHQGEREAAVKTIAQGMPGVSAALSLLACAKCTFFARKARGCGQHPAFPAPSCFRGRKFLQGPDAFAPRECAVVSLRLFDSLNMKRRRYPSSSLQGAKRRRVRRSSMSEGGSNPSLRLSRHGLLRGACHRARIRATRWLAMTTSDRRLTFRVKLNNKPCLRQNAEKLFCARGRADICNEVRRGGLHRVRQQFKRAKKPGSGKVESVSA